MCLYCRRSFSWNNANTKDTNEEEWFRRWVVEGYSARQLAIQSGHSQSKIYRILNRHMETVPPFPLSLKQHKHLVVDGTFIGRPRGLIALMDAEAHRLIAGQYGVSENSEFQLIAFFKHLISSGLQPHSFTVDGNPNVIKVLRKLWPEIKVQRCLVHIQRQGLSWCRTYPKTTYARKLRDIFQAVTRIHSEADRNKFLEMVHRWEEKYGSQISRRPESGYVFSDIKRARSMLIRALPNMFCYLEDPKIPTSTNGLESYFSRLKSHYRQHRGLSRKKRPNYFQWYMHFSQK